MLKKNDVEANATRIAELEKVVRNDSLVSLLHTRHAANFSELYGKVQKGAAGL